MLSEVLSSEQVCPPGCATCARLRDAVAGAVLMRGGGAVTLADLAAVAGVSVSHAEGHCPEGAAGAVAGAYRRAAGELYAAYAESFQLPGTWSQKFRAALARVLGRLAEEPAVAHLCILAPFSGDAELRAIREGYRSRYVELVTAEQRRLVGEVEPLPELQLELMFGAMFHTIGVVVAEGRAPELPAMIEEIAGAAQVFEPRVVVTA
jgi:hypothetical protein